MKYILLVLLRRSLSSLVNTKTITTSPLFLVSIHGVVGLLFQFLLVLLLLLVNSNRIVKRYSTTNISCNFVAISSSCHQSLATSLSSAMMWNAIFSGFTVITRHHSQKHTILHDLSDLRIYLTVVALQYQMSFSDSLLPKSSIRIYLTISAFRLFFRHATTRLPVRFGDSNFTYQSLLFLTFLSTTNLRNFSFRSCECRSEPLARASPRL